ncbi:UNVERIFIED_CONTAM: F-box only protein 13 [Sesamum calycinum]|uniref:F-box only protein 13 n=1 Tax=Sesamum calycinum TaxID=2727403 RepID=A0AAW2LXW0_9LAMI
MEAGDSMVCRRSHKRKLCEDESSRFPLNDLNHDLLERVLSWLPTSAFFRLTSVCKRWKSVADSATFRLACSQVPSRDPWFFMVDSQPHPSHQPIVFDSTEGNWKKLNHSPLLQLNQENGESCTDFIPVAASGGLICFHRADGEFIVNNPVTASCRRLNSTSRTPQSPIRAISMMSKAETFKLVLVSGELPNLTFREYNSTTDEWGEDIVLTRKADDRSVETETSDDCTQYFLSKCGNLVSTDIQRSPSKQYSSILTLKDGEEMLYFLSSSGTVVACNLTRRFFFEYPRLLPVFCEYSIDLVESGGQMYVVLLSEFLETASLRVWTWDDGIQCWRQIAAMPPSMSHKFYGKKVDINCTGAGKEMLVCVNSGQLCSYVMCNLAANEWVELPECNSNEKGREFVCAFSFEPRIEASIWGRM